MSYIQSVKKLLSDDLKALISHLTELQDGSADFKKCEDAAWSIILDQYHPSVDESNVKSTLCGFFDKFKFHGFHQKAKNITTLIDAYSNLDYFKKYSNTKVQWGLIHLLIKLSRKPTDSLVDDQPLDLLKEDQSAGDEEDFDWASYLKEGLERFRLQTGDDEDDSLSDWSEPEEERLASGDPAPGTETSAPPPVPVASSLASTQIPPRPVPLSWDRERAPLHIEVEDPGDCWWLDPNFRELPVSTHPDANVCITWEEENNVGPTTRILHEYKVLMELIHMLHLPSECYFIKGNSDGSFKTVEKTSISSLTPGMFASVIDENFCKYFPYIKKLQKFCQEVNEYDTTPNLVPATYRSYSSGIVRIFRRYNEKLIEIERRVLAQDDINTMRYLLSEIDPFLKQMEYLCKLHELIIPKDWRNKDLRSNSFSLLCGLYEELKESRLGYIGDVDWLSHNLLLFITESLEPFLRNLADHLAGRPLDPRLSSEFFLSQNGEILVQCDQPDHREFWEPVLKTASSALASCVFLNQFQRNSTFFNKGFPRDALSVRLTEKLSELILYKKLDLSKEARTPRPEDSHLIDLFDSSCPPMYDKTPADHLDEILLEEKLWSYPLYIFLQRAIVQVIEDFMEPSGFAAEILLDQLKFGEQLNALFNALQITSLFSYVIISKSDDSRNWKNIKFDFETCLANFLPQEFAERFELIIDYEFFNEEVSFIDFPDAMKLHYQVDSAISPMFSFEAISGYSDIFCFLLKIRLVLASLNRLVFEKIKETSQNFLRLNRLCSLRLWLLNAMNSLNSYISSFTDSEFQASIKSLCKTARQPHIINEAHMDFIKKWKSHCFINRGHPCYEHIMELLKLSQRLQLFYKMEGKSQLADFHLDDFEEAYSVAIRGFAEQLKLIEDGEQDEDFNFLCDSVFENIAL